MKSELPAVAADRLRMVPAESSRLYIGTATSSRSDRGALESSETRTPLLTASWAFQPRLCKLARAFLVLLLIRCDISYAMIFTSNTLQSRLKLLNGGLQGSSGPVSNTMRPRSTRGEYYTPFTGHRRAPKSFWRNTTDVWKLEGRCSTAL
eukprot:scaffold2157_cov376-Prasinococcus_capsulatus_cf.AAC.18